MLKRIFFGICLQALAVSVAAAELLSNSEVNSQWRSKVIAVKDGGSAPGVMTLLRAFHQALPTWVVGEVLKQYDHPAKGTTRDGSMLLFEDHDEDDFRILIDPKNGYADYSSLTDVDQMECCVWRRTNGHRIFAVSLYEQHDPVQHLLCWYDYDPQTQTMKAERSPIDRYRKPYEHMDISWTLPMKGTDFVISEYYYLSDADFKQVYRWDGMEHRHAKTQITDFRYQCFGEGDWMQASEQGFTRYALVDIDHSGNPSLCLGKADDRNWLIVDEFKGKMQTVTVNDEATMFESMYHVVPEAGKPWTEKDVVVYTSDFEHVHYYVVMQGGNIGYIVTSEPDLGEEGQVAERTPHKNGYGAKDESIDIIHAEHGADVFIKPQWKPFEFIEEEP